jgi:hypothetical protein
MVKVSQNSLNPKKRKRFTQDEDEFIKIVVNVKGKNCWIKLGEILNRDPKQVRDRYNNYLKEDLNKGPWSIEENEKLMQLQNGNLKNKWSKMEEFFPGRNQVQIKNQWNKLNSILLPTIKKIQNSDNLTKRIEVSHQSPAVKVLQALFGGYPDYNPPDPSAPKKYVILGNEATENATVQYDNVDSREINNSSDLEEWIKNLEFW